MASIFVVYEDRKVWGIPGVAPARMRGTFRNITQPFPPICRYKNRGCGYVHHVVHFSRRMRILNSAAITNEDLFRYMN